MRQLGGDEEIKEEKGNKILNSNKLLTRFPVLLAQIKAETNSYEVRKRIREIVHLIYQHNKIMQKLYNNLIKSL